MLSIIVRILCREKLIAAYMVIAFRFAYNRLKYILYYLIFDLVRNHTYITLYSFISGNGCVIEHRIMYYNLCLCAYHFSIHNLVAIVSLIIWKTKYLIRCLKQNLFNKTYKIYFSVNLYCKQILAWNYYYNLI